MRFSPRKELRQSPLVPSEKSAHSKPFRAALYDREELPTVDRSFVVSILTLLPALHTLLLQKFCLKCEILPLSPALASQFKLKSFFIDPCKPLQASSDLIPIMSLSELLSIFSEIKQLKIKLNADLFRELDDDVEIQHAELLPLAHSWNIVTVDGFDAVRSFFRILSAVDRTKSVRKLKFYGHHDLAVMEFLQYSTSSSSTLEEIDWGMPLPWSFVGLNGKHRIKTSITYLINSMYCELAITGEEFFRYLQFVKSWSALDYLIIRRAVCLLPSSSPIGDQLAAWMAIPHLLSNLPLPKSTPSVSRSVRRILIHLVLTGSEHEHRKQTITDLDWTSADAHLSRLINTTSLRRTEVEIDIGFLDLGKRHLMSVEERKGWKNEMMEETKLVLEEILVESKPVVKLVGLKTSLSD